MMKKLILMFITAATALSVQAQNINPEVGDYAHHNNDDGPPARCCHCDSLSGWSLDFNFMLGALNQQYTRNSPLDGYSSPLNPNVSGIQFNRGTSYGFEVQGGYFFDAKRNWGIGMGLTYFYQTGDLVMDNFHVEYASYDKFGNIFRQEVTATGQIKERLHIHNFNIPIVAKFQTDISKKVGFTADAGLLFNLHVQNNYTTNAAFDYEAIYKYVGTEGSVTTVYDNGNPPGSSDLLITKNQYLANTPAGDIQNYFDAQRKLGYNVGLGERPTNTKGNVSYTSGSIGLIIRPAVRISLSRCVSLNIGAYYCYQNFNNVAVSNYQITDKVGQYSSLLNTVTNTSNNSAGISIGVRYTFCRRGRPCAPPPEVVEPVTPEPDIEVASPVEPDEPEQPAHIDISTPLLFDHDKLVINESSTLILEEAIRELNENPNATLIIDGYTDNSGSVAYNKKLARRRAAAVRDYLKSKGINPKRLKAAGHGSNDPAASNSTTEGRMMNRRVIMRIK